MAKNSENPEFLSTLEKYEHSIEVRRAKFRATAHRESIISMRTKGAEEEFLQPKRPKYVEQDFLNFTEIDTKAASIEEWNAGTPTVTPKLQRKQKLRPTAPLPPTPTTPLPITPSTPPATMPNESIELKNPTVTRISRSPTVGRKPQANKQDENEKPSETQKKRTRAKSFSLGTSSSPAILTIPQKTITNEAQIPLTNSSNGTELGSSPNENLTKDQVSPSNNFAQTQPISSKSPNINNRIQFSSQVFEFIAQKRNAKTYQYNRRKLVIFQDKLTVYIRNKIHKEFNTKNLLQISRSIKYPRKIKLLWRYTNKVEKYLFASIEQRERFYEAIWVSQHGLNYHPFMNHIHNLKIFVGTWNMGNAPPPNGGPDVWLQKKMDYDLYVIGLQECDYPDAKDNNTSVESHLLRWFSSYLGKQYVKLVGLSLWEIRMFILVKREYSSAITNVKTGSLACGVAGVMANKGAVGVSFKFYETSLAFICCHLAAHQNKVEDRNENFRAVIRGISPSIRQINNSYIDITNQVDHLIWIGDLNYRIDLPREEVIELIADKKWNSLLKRDQLKREILMEKAFMGFTEGTIVFKPTYKYSIGSNSEYSEEKPVRVPAWCDRILWRSVASVSSSPTTEGDEHQNHSSNHHVNHDLIDESYGSCDEITTSDHHPVFATFILKTRLCNLPSERIEGFRIILTKLQIRELRFAYNDGSPSPYITFVAPFLENSVKTSSKEKNRNPDWLDTTIELIPIITNRDYLISQAIRVVIGDKGKIVQEKHKSQRWAQTVIPLNKLTKQPTPFECPLTSCGYGDCGTLQGEIFIDFHSSDDSPVDINNS